MVSGHSGPRAARGAGRPPAGGVWGPRPTWPMSPRAGEGVQCCGGPAPGGGGCRRCTVETAHRALCSARWPRGAGEDGAGRVCTALPSHPPGAPGPAHAGPEPRLARPVAGAGVRRGRTLTSAKAADGHRRVSASGALHVCNALRFVTPTIPGGRGGSVRSRSVPAQFQEKATPLPVDRARTVFP